MADQSVVLFHSTAHALRAEKVLIQAGFKIKMIPTPRQLSSDCGVCVRVNRGEKEQAVSILSEGRVEIDGVHDLL